MTTSGGMDMGRMVLGLGIGLGLLVGSGACSGSTTEEKNGVSCGEGTELVEGKCVAKQPGTTGGKTEVDGGEASRVDSGTAPPVADAGPDVSVDAATSSGDPCPPVAPFVNCSTTCGGVTSNCDAVNCGRSPAGRTYDFNEPPNITPPPYSMRTPDKPGVDARCNQHCGPMKQKAAYAMNIHMYVPEKAFVRVGAPWRISLDGMCISDEGPPPLVYDGCVFLGSGTFSIFTEDPNAPARNVTIEPTDIPHPNNIKGHAPCP